MRLYLDTAPVIYVVEQVPDFSEKILHYIQKPDIELVVSDLTWMECRVKPLTEIKKHFWLIMINFSANLSLK